MAGPQLRIKRLGGPLPMLRPESQCSLSDLPAGARRDIDQLLAHTPPRRDTRVADGYSYAITIEDEGSVVSAVTLPETAIPPSLTGLLS
jgi:hypothetical protein